MKIRSIIGSSIGNILEWYDFGLFAIFSPFFGNLFFPTIDQRAGMLAAFSIFAVGFICRPIGSILFGWLGDRRGRASTLRLSILMISLPTLLIAFLPTWSQVGLFAPILLTFIRIWQGISLGGEYSGNIIYLAETAPKNRRATLTSLAGTGANLGILLATLIGTLCVTFFSNHELKQWGWRIPYLISGILSLSIYFTRLQMDETHIFNYLKKKKKLSHNPLSTVFHHNVPQMLRTLGLVCLGSTFYYFSFIWLPVLLRESLHFSMRSTSEIFILLFSLMLLLVPLSGMLCDKIGRRKLLLFNASAVVVSVVPGLWLIQSGSSLVIFTILCIFTLISSLEQATTSIAVVENFPVPARYTGLSLSYNLGMGILGGTVPVICTWLTNQIHSSLAPAFYIATCALITAIVVWFFVPETQHTNLLET